MTYRFEQPPDNNMDYGADEMRRDELRRIEGRPMARYRITSATHKTSSATHPGLRDRNLQNGMLRHSKAQSSFVNTPATLMGKAGAKLGRTR